MKDIRTTLFIDGQWVEPDSDQTFSVVAASTEELVGQAPAANRTDVDRAVAAARRAFDHTAWPDMPAEERAAVLERLAAALDRRSADIARTVSTQNGMPISVSSQVEGQLPSVILRYYASLIQNTPIEEERAGFMGGTTLVRKEPMGVVAAIIPWNSPQILTAIKLAPALAAGCTIVIKPSPEAVLDSFLLAEAAEEAGLPPGVINIVPADREVGSHLVGHPGIDKVAFTGSTAAGRQVGEACGRLVRPVTLELGGKSAAIILDDADLDATVAGLTMASFLNNGQACYNATRILAPRSRYGEVVDAVAALARSFQVGDSLDPDTQVGPLVSARQRDRVEGYIANGKHEGARLVTGGGRPADMSRGWFVEPTVFADVDNTAVIAREEIFGPVVAVIPYSDVDEAVAIANDSEYGLGGSIWTADLEQGAAIARRVRTGTIGVNQYFPDLGAPFGGIKSSGIGREFGPEGLLAYQQYKSVYLPPEQPAP